MLQNAIQCISVAMTGIYINESALAASAQGTMFAMVTGFCLVQGGSTAFDTLASPMFSIGHHQDVGLLLLRIQLLIFIFYIPILFSWIFGANVLTVLGQPAELASSVQIYLRGLMWGMLGYILFETTKKFCQVQNKASVSTTTLCLTCPIHCINCYFLTRSYGITGTAISTSLSYWLSFAILQTYVSFGSPTNCLFMGSFRAIFDMEALLIMIKLFIPGFFMIGTEWWAFELVALISSLLSANELSAQSVVMTGDQILNTLPFGLGIISSTRIGYLLGSETSNRNIKELRYATYATAVFATIQGGIVGLVLYALRYKIGSIFSDNPDVVRLVADVIPFVALFQVFDGWSCGCGGVLRGMGKQELGARLNLFAYYVVALPLGYCLSIKTHLGLAGLWLSLDFALFLVGATSLTIALKTDWENEFHRVQNRIASESYQ